MKMTYEDLTEQWGRVAQTENAYLLQNFAHPLDIYIGHDEKLDKTLYIEGMGKFVKELPSSESITVKNHQRSDGEWVLSFHLTRYENKNVFMKLCWDIITSTGESEKQYIKCISDRYLMWYDLMQKKRQKRLSFSVQKGLIGELLYLKELICNLGCERAVSSWAGPNGADQDFIYDETWCEVKAVKAAAVDVWISSLEQLDSQTEGTLRLYYMEKTTVEDILGISLFQAVKNIRDLLRGHNMAERDFEALLCRYGYDDGEAEYSELKFRHLKSVSYRVDASFPKLTRDSISVQINEVKYSLNLGTITKFEIIEGNNGTT